MGQYYKAVIISENEEIKTLSPCSFDNGRKLMEFSWCGNVFVNAVLSRIHNKRAKVVFIGDYAMKDYKICEEHFTSIMTKKAFSKYFNAAWDRSEKYKLPRSDFACADLGLLELDTIGAYLVNHDKRVFLDIEAYVKDSLFYRFDIEWAVNPLPLLTLCSNGGGGSFYTGNVGGRYVGIWAFDTLEHTHQIPKGYEQVHYVFMDEQEDEEASDHE